MTAALQFQGNSLAALLYWPDKVARFVLSLTRFPGIFLQWLIGMTVLTLAGVLYTLLFYFPVLLTRKLLKFGIGGILKSVDSLDEQASMKLHSDMEYMLSQTRHTMRIIGKFYVFWPIKYELMKAVEHLAKAESALLAKAYPNYNQPLTPEEKKDLFETMRSWREDERENKETY